VSRKRRILLVTDLFPPVLGGVERHVDALARLLVVRGHAVHVATCTRNPQPSDPNVVVHTIPTTVSRVVRFQDADRPFASPLPDPEAHTALARLVRDIKPDLIHAHGWLAVSLPRRHRPPLVFTAHDYAQICQRHTLLRFSRERCGGPSLIDCVRCGAEQYGYPKSVLGALSTPVGAHVLNADRVLAVSNAVADTLRPHLRTRVSVLHNFVEAGNCHPLERPAVLPVSPFVLYAGDPGKHKGVDVLLDAWTGDDAPSIELFLATTRELGRALPPRVSTARLDLNEMPSAWHAAHAAVVPSVWADPFPLVALEAMQAGTPVIASRVGGLPELVQNELSGLLIEPNDVIALRFAVARLVSEPNLRDFLSDGARVRAAEFAPEPVIDQLESVYDEVMANT
jgi:glycosyltransferase involved in cell wall biosynthesis